MTTTDTLACWLDTSEFQSSPYTNDYNHRIAAFRCMDGDSYTDLKFAVNLAWGKFAYAQGWVDFYIAYFVYRLRGAATLYAAWTKKLGPYSPGLVIMIDVENWSGAITGNHSPDLNTLFGMLAAYTGMYSRVIGYGNKGDLAAIWANRDARCWVIVAGYGSTWTFRSVFNAFAQQYTNGIYTGPSGWPNSSPPFGKADHNGAPDYNSKTLAQKLLGSAAVIKKVMEDDMPWIARNQDNGACITMGLNEGVAVPEDGTTLANAQAAGVLVWNMDTAQFTAHVAANNSESVQAAAILAAQNATNDLLTKLLAATAAQQGGELSGSAVVNVTLNPSKVPS